MEKTTIATHFLPMFFFSSSKTISFIHGNIRFDSKYFNPIKIINHQARIANMDNLSLISIYDTESYSFNISYNWQKQRGLLKL